MSEASQRFARVEELFLAALELDPQQREGFLDDSCRGDERLRQQVEAMLAADAGAHGRIESAVEGQAAVLTAETSQDRVGARIGHYRLLCELGRGGMSVVYLAARSDAQFEQKVAIKLIAHPFLSQELRRRLLVERQILARLRHPNIARLLDGGSTADGVPYFVMEYIDGLSLDRYCDEHRLSVRQRLILFRKVCSAVHSAHRSLVVHRDLKPSNVMVDSDGEPKLLDFGIAKLLADEAAAATDATRSLLWMGTPGYASPEQLLGEPVTTASDVYSLGVLLYRLLTGERPLGEASGPPPTPIEAMTPSRPLRPSVAAAAVEAEVAALRGQRPRALARSLEGDLDNILLMCLRREPERRYGSVEQLSEDLERHLSGHPVIARPVTLRYRVSKFVGRNRWSTLFATAAVALVVAFALAMAVQQEHTARQRDRAERVSAMLAELFEVAGPTAQRGSTITARELLERGKEQLAGLDEQPRDQAMLRDTLGGLYEQLGLFDEAQELFRQALEQRRQLYGPRHLEVAESLYHYGRASARKEEFEQAEQLFRQALAIRREQLSEGHLDVLTSLNSLALVLHETGDYGQAEGLYREAAAKNLRWLGADHPQTIKTQYNLALLLHDKGEDGEAEPLFRRILEFKRLDADEDSEAEVKDLLGHTLHAAGKLHEAEEMLRSSLDQRLRIYGEEHPLVARTENHLGDVLRRKGDLAASEPLLLDALRLRRGLLGEQSAEVAESLASLAGLRTSQERFEQADSLFAAAASTYRQSFSPQHPFVGRVLADWGAMLAGRGDCDRAQPLLSEALELLPPADPRGRTARAAAGLCR